VPQWRAGGRAARSARLAVWSSDARAPARHCDTTRRAEHDSARRSVLARSWIDIHSLAPPCAARYRAQRGVLGDREQALITPPACRSPALQSRVTAVVGNPSTRVRNGKRVGALLRSPMALSALRTTCRVSGEPRNPRLPTASKKAVRTAESDWLFTTNAAPSLGAKLAMSHSGRLNWKMLSKAPCGSAAQRQRTAGFFSHNAAIRGKFDRPFAD
jgi:hypothetical protein